MSTIEFKEPQDYSVDRPEVTIDDCTYDLYDAGSLSIATPKLLSEAIQKLRTHRVSNSA